MKRTSPRLIVTSVAAAALLASAGVATAQEQHHRQLPERGGVLFGFGIGGGSMSCQSDQDICNGTLDSSGSIDAHIGGMISPRLALMGDFWVMYHSENNVTVTHAISTLAVQFWLAPRLWIKGGVGSAVARAHYQGALIALNSRTDSVPGVMAGVGYELLVSRKFALDLQLKGGTGFYKDNQVRAKNAALIVGFNWY